MQMALYFEDFTDKMGQFIYFIGIINRWNYEMFFSRFLATFRFIEVCTVESISIKGSKTRTLSSCKDFNQEVPDSLLF